MISANGVEYKNVPEQVQYLTEQVADIWTAIDGLNPPDLTLYALKTYVDAADTALGNRITAVESSIGTLLTKTEAANTYAKIADIGTYINLSDYVKTTDMYAYVQSEIQNFDLDTNTDFTALKSRVSTLETSVSSMTSDIADANTTAANAQTAAGNAVNTANNASAVATNAYNTATSAASDVADMQTTINNYDSRIDAVESTVTGFQASLTTAQNTANAALAKADSALSMIAGLHSLTKQEAEFEGDSVTVTGFVEGSLCTLTKLEGNTRKSINIWDEQWELGGLYSGVINSKNYIPVFPSTAYYLKSPYQVGLICYDVGKNMILTAVAGANATFTTPSNCHYIKFYCSSDYGTTYNNDICINESDADINGTYYPYFDGLKSVSISGLSSGGGVVITTSEGTTSLVPDLDDDTLELRSWSYIEQSITDTSLVTTYVEGSGAYTFTGNETLNLFTMANGDKAYSVSFSSLNLGNAVSTNPTPCVNNFGMEQEKNFDFFRIATTPSFAILWTNAIYFYSPTLQTASDMLQYLTGKSFVYELATPVTTVLATVTYTDVSAFFETGATITVNNANNEYDVESTSTMYGYVAE